jgi:MFS family permease
MRGRVMALYSIVFLGSTPIGGPIAGWLSEALDPRAALLMAAAAALAAGVLARLTLISPARFETAACEGRGHYGRYAALGAPVSSSPPRSSRTLAR